MSVQEIDDFLLKRPCSDDVIARGIKLIVLADQWEYDGHITAKGYNPHDLRSYLHAEGQWTNYPHKLEGICDCLGSSSSMGFILSADYIRYYVDDNVLLFDKFTEYYHGGKTDGIIYSKEAEPVQSMPYNSIYLLPLIKLYGAAAIKPYITYP